MRIGERVATWLAGWKGSGDDVLAGHRDRIMSQTAIAGLIVLVPLAINNFVQGRHLLGVLVVIVVAGLGSDALAIRLKKRPPIPFALLLLIAGVAMAYSLKTQGIYGALWSYPLVLFCYFVMAWRAANLCSLALLAAVTAMVDHYVDRGTAIRVFASLILTIAIINVILNIIGDLQRRLLEQTIRDPLTGVFNRRHMDARLGEEIERNKRSGAHSALLLIDIDHFKRINDELGHEAGDRVLKEVVSIIQSNSRRLDSLFRAGGEEFLLLLPDTARGAGMKVAEHLRGLVAESRMLDGRNVTVSIGVSELEPGARIDTWIKRADDALYAAKRAGRNQVAQAEAKVG